MKTKKILKILNSNRIFTESKFELIEEEFESEDGRHYVEMYIDSSPSPNVINEKDWVHQCISKNSINNIIKEAQKEVYLKIADRIGVCQLLHIVGDIKQDEELIKEIEEELKGVEEK